MLSCLNGIAEYAPRRGNSGVVGLSGKKREELKQSLSVDW